MGLVHQRLQLLFVTNIAGDAERFALAKRVDLGGGGVQLVLLAGRDDDCRAMLGQTLGHRQPHALGGAGQQRHLSGQIE